MSEGSETPSEEERSLFRPLTRDSLAVIEARIEEETAKKKELQKKRQEEGTRYDDEDDDDGPKSDPNLEAGMPLPIRLAAEFNPELVGTPIEDIDPYYSNQRTFVVISKGKDIFRFSSTSSLWTISPFNPLRRTALYILVHPLFSILIISTILANCILMSMTPTPKIESTEVIFTSIYTFEAAIKVTARGFIMEKFTYLRDAWNWLDFIVIALAYLTMGVDLGNFAALRTFRVLRALKTVAIVPGLKTIVGAVIESVKNLKDVIILTMFSLSVFALLGLQVYMGYLTQKCILDVPSNLTLTDEEWFNHCSNSSHWYMDEATKKYPLCGNATGAGTCPDGYTCIQGFGGNPDYGYTSFDTFGWALLSSFRLMTQDAWETLYHQVLRSAGPWHMLFFIVIIFIGSYYLVNLILAIVAMSYDELNKKAEAEEKAQAKEQAAMKREEEIVMESAAAGGHGKKRKSPRSPRSTNSGDSMLYGQQSTGDEEIDRRRPLVDGDSLNEHKGRLNGKVRSAAYPHSAHHRRTSSFSSGLSWRTSRSRSRRSYSTAEKVPLVVPAYGAGDSQDSVPFADDSDVLTPISDTAGALASSGRLGSRYASCDSHLARLSFTSHGDLSDSSFPVGKNRRPPSRVKPESYSCGSKSSQILDAKALQDLVLTPRKQAPGGGGPKQGDAIEAFLRNIFSERDLNLQYIDKESANGNGIAGPHGEGDADLAEGEVERTSSNPFVESNGRRSLDVKDVMDLKDLIDQAGRRSRASSRPDDDDEEEHKTSKEKLLIFLDQATNFLCIWECCEPWRKFKRVLEFIVFDPFVELFITLCILVNTLFMALDQHGMDEDFSKALSTGNYFFTATFAIECAMKLMAMSPKYYFQVGWNIFDFIIVALSLAELSLENVSGLSVLRSFRLLRVFKLAKSWPTLNLLISIMGKTIGALGNLTFVLWIIIFIFAVMGMQLFGKNYIENKHLLGGEVPRWNFTDFMHSFMIVFRVLCGEWIESMWDCMVVGDLSCIPFFMATVVIGNLVVLNLFLALLLSSFGASSLSSPQTDSDTNKLTEAFARFGRFFRWIKGLLRRCFRKALRSRSTRVSNAGDSVHENSNSVGSVAGREENGEGQVEAENPQQTALTSSDKSNCVKVKPVDPSDGSQSDSMEFPAVGKLRMSDGHDSRRHSVESWIRYDESDELARKSQHESRLEQSIDVGTADILLAEQPADCCSPSCYKNFPFLLGDDESPLWQGWAQLRCKTFRLIENKYFETAVITMILLSSLALALEDVYLPQKPLLQDILYYMDRIFTVIFFLEMLIKWLALGFNSYFHNAWCWLDFVIVMVSLINLTASLLGANGIQAFKTMRTLRALRPLRALSRMQGMRVVVNALVQAIPSIFNVLMVCLIFWLIFAIMGVQMFAGKFYKCLDEDDHLVPVEIVDDMHECIAKNYTWVNSKINFDNVLQAYLALFQVATFKGWIPIMGDAIDSRGLGKQPVKEHNTLMYLYFVFFIIIGSLFTLNLFIGVIIDNFNEQKKKMRGSLEMFMTEEQKKYYNAMKKMGSKKPLKAIPRPKWRPQAIVFEIVTNSTFDLVIMGAIGLNMVVMTLDRYQMSKEWEYGLEMTNTVFIVIFTSECLLKIFALRWFYFKEPWNLFDFVVVILSILGLVLSDIIERYFVSPTLLRVVRVAKVGRVLRLVKGAKGIRTLLFALAMSLPALFNIFLLLFLVMFIYAIFGMSFFMHVKYTGGLDPVFNFETFGNSMILLFQIMTSAGWDSVLEGITNEDDCEKPDLEKGNPGNCGSYATGLAYLVSYLMISFLIVINMYIAVILENYSQATEDVSEGLTGDDYDMYYEIWQQFDPKGTQYIPYSRLSEFLHVLEPPLQIHKPNKYKIVSMDIPLCTGDRVYCVDVLDALTKDFFARKGNPIQDSPEFGQVAPAVERPDYEPISSTLWRQREEHCVRMVQKAWVQHKNMKIQERQRRQQQEMEKQRRQQEEMETEQSGDAQLAEDASNPPPSNFNSMGGERDSPSSPPSQTN